jgi:hypothetical protein
MTRTHPVAATRGSRLALAASIAVWCLAAQQTSAGESARATCRLGVHAVETESSSRHHGASAGSGPSRFSAYGTSMLEFDLLCRGAAPFAERIRLDVHLPGGELYRSLTMNRVEVEGHSSKGKGLHLVGTARFPVRGTFVTQNGLFGEWSAQLCREVGPSVTCDAGITFELDRE